MNGGQVLVVGASSEIGTAIGAALGPVRRPAGPLAAVRFVVEFGDHGCPTEIRLQPHLG